MSLFSFENLHWLFPLAITLHNLEEAIRLAGKIFRIGILMYGKRPHIAGAA